MMVRRTRSALVALVALPGLLLAGCGNDDGGTGNGATDTTADGNGDGGNGRAPLVTCSDPEEGYEIGYPEDWYVNPGDTMSACALFDREPIEDVEPGTEIPRDIAVTVLVESVPYEELVDADRRGEEVLAEDEPVIGDLTVTRIEARATEEAPQREPGTRSTRWIVDLGDDRSLVASTVESEEEDYEANRAILDAMVGSLELTDGGSSTTTTSPSDEGPDPVGDPDTSEVATDDFPSQAGETAELTDVRAASRDGFDRVVLEFRGDDPPSYRVAYSDGPVYEAGRGREVEVSGDATIEVIAQPATGVDLSGEQPREIYEGPDRIEVGGDGPVTEVVQTGDFENVLAWAIGVERERPFGVTVLQDPLRLVIDVVEQ